jgi:hypothetical protein
MLTPEQKQAVVESWKDESAQKGFALGREHGQSPQDCADAQAKAIRYGMMLVAAGSDHKFSLTGVDPLLLADALEAGELNQEIAVALGYV